MNKSLSISDSLIGSLCREIEYLRTRYRILNNYLIQSKDKGLKKRLKNEIEQIILRRYEIFNISKILKRQINSDVSSQLLYELCNRPFLNINNKI